jgi:hypothetical protein
MNDIWLIYPIYLNIYLAFLRHLTTMAIEVYKILHQESPSYLQDLIKIKDTKYCFRYDNITEIPSVRTTRYGLKSASIAAARVAIP